VAFLTILTFIPRGELSHPTTTRRLSLPKPELTPPTEARTLYTSPKDRPDWAIPCGREFWQLGPASSNQPEIQPGKHGLPGSVISQVIDRVSYALRLDHAKTAAVAAIPGAIASLSPSGVSFTSPQRASEWEEIRFRTGEVWLGGRLLASSASRHSAWSVQGNSMQVLRDGATGLIEHYQARRRGVEVTWILPHRPRSSGELRIEAELSGVQFRSRSAAGLHFGSPDLASRITIGSVLAVDSSGRSWPASVEAAGSMVRITVPEEILAEASYPLAIDPLVSPEFGFDAPIDVGSPSTRAVPAIAAGESGTGCLGPRRR
jgi:hypothetical protein